MAKGTQLRFDITDPAQANKQRHIAVLRKAGVYNALQDCIGGNIENQKQGFEYVWLYSKSATDMQRKLTQGYEIVYTPTLERKCKCVKDGEPLPECVACKGRGKEKYPDPRAEMTPHHCEDGTHCWGDTILSRAKKDVFDAWKALPVIQANEAIQGSRSKTLGRFHEAGVEASLGAEDTSK